jgi:hypothetical protein
MGMMRRGGGHAGQFHRFTGYVFLCERRVKNFYFEWFRIGSTVSQAKTEKTEPGGESGAFRPLFRY